VLVAALAGCAFHAHPGADNVIAPDATGGSAYPIVGPHGVYVPTFGASLGTDPDLQLALASASVDGMFITRPWKDVEPTADAYDFESRLGVDLRAVAAAGKHATIAIEAGINSPAYLCASTSCLNLIVHFKQGNGQCIQELLPIPWDPVVQMRFGNMVAALGAYIAADPVLASTVVGVKITGFNDHDAETILPNQTGLTETCTVGNACQSGSCSETDTVTAFQAAGYTADVATAAFATFAMQFRAAFPTTPIGSQITSVFPALPDSTTPDRSIPVAMVDNLVADTTMRPIMVQDNGLTATGGIDAATVAAHGVNVPIGFQMLAYVASNPTCLMAGTSKVPCAETVLRDAIDLGLSSGATWLEIYKQDVAAYPSSIAYAHGKLVP
jgi:hypothetical protein